MITQKSSKREIRDLQRLLISVGHLTWTVDAKSGKWGRETQDAVAAAYAAIGWDHAPKGRWISAAALAAIAAGLPPTGGPGSHAGGPGSHAGGAGSHAGGAGSHAGGAGSHAGGAAPPE